MPGEKEFSANFFKIKDEGAKSRANITISKKLTTFKSLFSSFTKYTFIWKPDSIEFKVNDV